MKSINNILLVILLLAVVIFAAIFMYARNTNRENSQRISDKGQVLIRAAIPYWEQEAALESFKTNVQRIDHVSLFWYYVNEESDIVAYDENLIDEEIINLAHANGVKVQAVLTNLEDEWDSDRIRSIIESPEKRQNHIRDIVRLLEEKNFDGISVDYEELDDDLEDEFSTFIQELSAAVHERGKTVGVALHPKSGEDIPRENNGSRAQDWKALATYADYLYLMSYGEHWNTSKAGPIASIKWLTNMISYAERLEIPMEKIFLGVPLYGVDWNKDDDSSGEGVQYQEVQVLLGKYNPEIIFDEARKSPHFFYEEDGDRHEVWFENAQSVQAKVEFARQSGLGGVTLWSIGKEDQKIWSKL